MQDMPERYPHPASRRRRRVWEDQGARLKIRRALQSEMNDRARLDRGEPFLRGSCASAKEATPKLEKNQAGPGDEWMELVDGGCLSGKLRSL